MADEEVRELLGRHGYELKRFISRGGQGRVYEVFDFSKPADLALKLVAGGDCGTQARLALEYGFLRGHTHPNLLTVFDYRQASWRSTPYTWFTMELCQGSLMTFLTEEETRQAQSKGSGTTRRMIDSIRGRGQQVRRLHVMELSERVVRMLECLDGLAYIHQQGLSHRDIKPGNLLVHRDGRLKLGDFGTAKLTRAGTPEDQAAVQIYLVGTPQYIAPELWRSLHREELPEPDLMLSDQYALAVTLCEFLQRGRLPSKLSSLPGQLRTAADWLQHLNIHSSGIFEELKIPERSATPESVNEVLHKMLSPDPHRRYTYLSRCMIDLVAACLKDGLLRA